MYRECSRVSCLNSCGVLPLLNDLSSSDFYTFITISLCFGRLVYKDSNFLLDWVCGNNRDE